MSSIHALPMSFALSGAPSAFADSRCLPLAIVRAYPFNWQGQYAWITQLNCPVGTTLSFSMASMYCLTSPVHPRRPATTSSQNFCL